MYKGKTILALIPARGGSKGLPRKNIRLLLGKPLIAWTIEQAKASKYIDRVVVSTDDEEIAEIAKRYGAEVPFMRPKELARDDTPGIDIVFHAMDWFIKNENKQYDLIILLQPTSPLRTTEDIDKAIEKFMINYDYHDSLVSVTDFVPSPLWAMIKNGPYLEPVFGFEVLEKNRQELPKYLLINGAIYIIKVNVLKKEKNFFTKKTIPFYMPKERSIDIDDEIDFMIAENIMKILKLY